jgi:hypothetical protein
MRTIPAILILLLIIAGCSPEEIDDQKPVINLSPEGSFPVSCDTLYLGETFTWRVRFTDNVVLGSYSIDIHHNFDQHAHSTEVEVCDLNPVKAPANPFKTIMDFEIPTGSVEFEAEETISIPLSDENGEFDTGDYHFFIRLTDRSGWSTQKGFNIKILKR